MPPDRLERRGASRRLPCPEEALSRVRLRTGRELAVVNISDSGALLEGTTRLLPGTHADVHIITKAGRVLVRTRIVRAVVWRLESDAVHYRAAVTFDTALDTAPEGYPIPAETSVFGGGPGIPYPQTSALGEA